MKTDEITPARVRDFLITSYAGKIQGRGVNPAEIPDSFDFLLQGVIDSLGFLEMVGAMEREFGLELDMADLDAEQMTVLGPLSQFVAAQIRSRTAPGGPAASSSQPQD